MIAEIIIDVNDLGLKSREQAEELAHVALPLWVDRTGATMTLGPVVPHHELPGEPIALVAPVVRMTNLIKHVDAGVKANAAQPLHDWP